MECDISVVKCIKASDPQQHEYLVYFSNGEKVDCSAEELYTFSLFEGRPLRYKTYEDFTVALYTERAKEEVMQYVVFSKRSSQQVRRKIQTKGYDDTIADTLIEELTEKGYLDDYKYCLKMIQKAVNTRIVSEKMLRYELACDGIGEIDIDRAFEELEIDDFVLIKKAVDKKRRLSNSEDNKKLIGFLQRKAFSSEAIRYALESAEEEQD